MCIFRKYFFHQYPIFHNIVAPVEYLNNFLIQGAKITTAKRSKSDSIHERAVNRLSEARGMLSFCRDSNSCVSIMSSIESAERVLKKINENRIDYPYFNCEYNSNFDFIWKKTEYQSYMQQVMKAITCGAINGLFQIKQ